MRLRITFAATSPLCLPASDSKQVSLYIRVKSCLLIGKSSHSNKTPVVSINLKLRFS